MFSVAFVGNSIVSTGKVFLFSLCIYTKNLGVLFFRGLGRAFLVWFWILLFCLVVWFFGCFFFLKQCYDTTILFGKAMC